jgi:signal peptidase I
VFEYPEVDPGGARFDYVERVVGIAGDTIAVRNGRVVVNGSPQRTCRVGTMTIDGVDGSPRPAEIFVEFLDGAPHLVLLDPDAPTRAEGPYPVKDGEVFVLGDNRHHSADSRSWNHGQGAGVPVQKVKGRVSMVWLPPERLFVSVHEEVALPPRADGATRIAPPELREALSRCLEGRVR